MILIPAGSFQMGCDSSNPAETCDYNDELPLHTVNLSAYSIDKYEVTNARYTACVDAGGCSAPQSANSRTRAPYYGTIAYADYPVINVTWHQARAYCAWAVAQGLLAIRSHVDVCDDRLLAVDALLDVKRRVAPYLDLQLVGFPQDGLLRSPTAHANLLRALDRGVDVVGGIPHFERTMADGAESVRLLCEIAAERGVPVDLHGYESGDPLSGHVWVFHSRDRRSLKLLMWDTGGFLLIHKRLEKGRFRPPRAGGRTARLTAAELTALLEGIDLTGATRLSRWNPPEIPVAAGSGRVTLHA